jgi:hypothetical protein
MAPDTGEGLFLRFPHAVRRIVVQPSCTANGCKVDRARNRSASCRRAQTSDAQLSGINDVTMAYPLTSISSCEVSFASRDIYTPIRQSKPATVTKLQ